LARPNRNTIELRHNVVFLDSREIRGPAPQDRSQFDSVDVHSRNLNSFSIAVFVTNLSASLGATLKLSCQPVELIARNGLQLGGLLRAIAEVFYVDSLSDRRFAHQLFYLILVLDLLAIETQNHIAAHESGFVSRSARCSDGFEDDSLISFVKTIDTYVRLDHRNRETDVCALMNRGYQRREGSRANEEHKQADKKPRHPAHAPFFLESGAACARGRYIRVIRPGEGAG